jgi:hypothetical protein
MVESRAGVSEDAMNGDNFTAALTKRPLSEYCYVLPGRNRVAPLTEGQEEFRLIRAEDIGAELTSWTELPHRTHRKSTSVEVHAGDIIGSISGPHGRWVIVPDGYGPALAGDHTIVLRKCSDAGMWYILGFLRSDSGKRHLKETLRGSVILRIGKRELEQVPVPCYTLGSGYVDRVLRTYDHELRRLEGEIDKLRNHNNHVFESTTSTKAPRD